MKQRYLTPAITKALDKKMVFVCGPRQSGKTTLAKIILKTPSPKSENLYLNWDAPEGREIILKNKWTTSKGILVLDEIHKYKNWRNLLKGLFDTRGKDLKILVTGSARLDYYRKGGDSLQGRYRMFRLHPLSLAETGKPSKKNLESLLKLGPFPEPYFGGSESEARIWRRDYRQRLVREDLSDLEQVRELSLVELMATRLPDLVGNPLSINSLREDLQINHETCSRWLDIFDNLYYTFRVAPFGPPKLRAVKKESKLYHYDWALVPKDGPRFENMVASHLLKWCHFIEDTEGFEMQLRYFRDTSGREVDFVVLKDSQPHLFVEAKFADEAPSPHLRYLKTKYPKVPAVQVVFESTADFTNSDGIRVCGAQRFLGELV